MFKIGLFLQLAKGMFISTMAYQFYLAKQPQFFKNFCNFSSRLQQQAVSFFWIKFTIKLHLKSIFSAVFNKILNLLQLLDSTKFSKYSKKKSKQDSFQNLIFFFLRLQMIVHQDRTKIYRIQMVYPMSTTELRWRIVLDRQGRKDFPNGFPAKKLDWEIENARWQQNDELILQPKRNFQVHKASPKSADCT